MLQKLKQHPKYIPTTAWMGRLLFSGARDACRCKPSGSKLANKSSYDQGQKVRCRGVVAALWSTGSLPAWWWWHSHTCYNNLHVTFWDSCCDMMMSIRRVNLQCVSLLDFLDSDFLLSYLSLMFHMRYLPACNIFLNCFALMNSIRRK